MSAAPTPAASEPDNATESGISILEQLKSNHHEMANALRALAMDAVERANSGHPGLPMGAADIATVLFTRHLTFDPGTPHWPDRDRFILSAGHGSMLLYAALHLLGYEDFPIGELKNFRQLGAKTAGHPEYGHGAGIETTTGPLGQGLANGVGMALAERMLAARFGEDIVNHFTYVLAGDGDLMEGISHEAVSFAGHLALGRLIVLFDDNGISIDGPLSLSETGDQLKRFEAAGWDVAAIDGHDPEAIDQAIVAAKKTDKPSLIACKTIIGYGAPGKQGTSGVHGAPLGSDEVAAARKTLGWDAEPFDIPAAIRDAWRLSGLCHAKARRAWEKRLEALAAEPRGEFERAQQGGLPGLVEDAFATLKQTIAENPVEVATRSASQHVLEAITPVVPEMVGGSADLTGSNNTRTKDMVAVTRDDFSGRFIHYGVREHGMAAAMNGMALHGGLIPYGGTFLVFADYMRPALRLAALMRLRVIHVLTHDSIGLGEDGPTHQPVETLASLRAIPNLHVFRPADLMETAECWQLALEARGTPSVLALTRQKLPAVRGEAAKENCCAHGAYELKPASGEPVASLFATGSEVHLALQAQAKLEERGMPVRVVSVPCFELFAGQDEEYRARIIGDAPVRVGIEAAIRMGWDRIIGSDGLFIGMRTFGASAPCQDLYRHFGITADEIVRQTEQRLRA